MNLCNFFIPNYIQLDHFTKMFTSQQFFRNIFFLNSSYNYIFKFKIYNIIIVFLNILWLSLSTNVTTPCSLNMKYLFLFLSKVYLSDSCVTKWGFFFWREIIKKDSISTNNFNQFYNILRIFIYSLDLNLHFGF